MIKKWYSIVGLMCLLILVACDPKLETFIACFPNDVYKKAIGQGYLVTCVEYRDGKAFLYVPNDSEYIFENKIAYEGDIFDE